MLVSLQAASLACALQIEAIKSAAGAAAVADLEQKAIEHVLFSFQAVPQRGNHARHFTAAAPYQVLGLKRSRRRSSVQTTETLQ